MTSRQGDTIVDVIMKKKPTTYLGESQAECHVIAAMTHVVDRCGHLGGIFRLGGSLSTIQ